MNLIPDDLRAQLVANGRRSIENDRLDPPPVVKLFTPDAGATWLLTEIDPDDVDRAFGLCDLGLGFPELGYVSLAELTTVRARCDWRSSVIFTSWATSRLASMHAKPGQPEESWRRPPWRRLPPGGRCHSISPRFVLQRRGRGC